MKGLLIIAAVALGGFGLVWGVFVLSARFGPDAQAAMTQEATEVVVNDSEFEDNNEFSQSRGFRVTYEYTDGEDWYASDDWVPQQSFEPGSSLRVCLDPGAPAEHVVVSRPGAECGDDSVGVGDVLQAEPTAAPGDAG